MTTPVDVRDRVMALAARIQLPTTLNPMHVYEAEEECSFAESDLPAMVISVSPRPRTYAWDDSNSTHTTTFELLLSLYVSHVCDTSYGRDISAYDIAEIGAQTVVDTFAARPTLSMNYDHGLVDRAEITRGAGPHTMPTKGTTNKNLGFQFRMTVILRRVVEIDDE